MQRCAEDWIHQLNMQPHPEGGYFAEVFRSGESIPAQGLPERYPEARCLYTSIFFLLEAPQVSRLHRLRSDEIWYFHDGLGLSVHVLEPAGEHECLELGLRRGQLPQILVPHGAWFGAELTQSEGYALVGCLVAPGFEFDDFELARSDQLVRQYPQHREWISRLT